MRGAALALALMPLIAGCGLEPRGDAAPYLGPGGARRVVSVPPGAPSISQQFLSDQHPGIDIWGPVGTPVLAAAAGRVTQSAIDPAYGNRIVLDHGRDAEGRAQRTVYKHLDTREAPVGTTVARGARIGTLGRTGVLAGLIPHLHFELLRGTGRGPDLPEDPNALWLDGPGRITCFDPATPVPPGPLRLSYPVACAAT